MRRYACRVREAASACGREPRSVKILFGLQVVVAGSCAEAEDKAAFFNSFIDVEGALSRLSTGFGVDLSKFDLDRSIMPFTVQSSSIVASSLPRWAGRASRTTAPPDSWAMPAAGRDRRNPDGSGIRSAPRSRT
jgi:alkanesulfonate monooxygenase SsuD/methylene tetrahydromethanopterin reductase-like flavin-dependent oxidoreductase (luciferase family)